MTAYYCTNCGRTSYSAAKLEDMTDKRCPYCGEEDGDENLRTQPSLQPL
jgi:anaerobic ribonucleoside-triphosphate reductase